VPHRVTIGERGLKAGEVEYQHRRDTTATAVSCTEIFNLIQAKLKL